MNKNILIAGKDFPACDDFANSFALGEYNVVVAGNQDTQADTSTDIKIANWNKDSAISARSFVIQAETFNGYNENYILYFDAEVFSAQYLSCTTDICARALDNMILGYQYLALEIITRIEQHKVPAKIFFILKSHPTKAEVLKNSKKSVLSPASPIVSAAEAAFATFAENLAADKINNEFVSIFLISGDSANETIQKDSSLGSWLKEYIDSLNAMKKIPKSVNWIKAGAKASGGFPFFR